jgi:transcriptional regulator with XRE-family HTH domain
VHDEEPLAPALDPSELRLAAEPLLADSTRYVDLSAAALDESSQGPAGALRRARQERGLTLSEVAKVTGIWARYLTALESDAPLEEFPGPAYARFFLREYAEFLGLDPGSTLRAFDLRHPVLDEPTFEPLPNPMPRRILARLLAVASVALLIGIALLPLTSRPSAEPAHHASVSAPKEGFGHAPAAGHTVPPAVRGVRATLRLSQPCWVWAVSDGRVVSEQTLPPGQSVVFRAHHVLRLKLGNAGGVILQVNGDRVPTGAPGQVVSLEFRWQDGRLSSKIL